VKVTLVLCEAQPRALPQGLALAQTLALGEREALRLPPARLQLAHCVVLSKGEEQGEGVPLREAEAQGESVGEGGALALALAQREGSGEAVGEVIALALRLGAPLALPEALGMGGERRL
jgi:hypothetical protein